MSLQEELHRAHKEHLIRMSRPPQPKVEQRPEPVRTPAVEFDSLQAWIERQKAIPLPKEPWFSMVSDFDTTGPTIEKIIFATAQYFELPTKDLRGTYRTAHIAYARQIAFFLCRNLTVRSFPEIGRRFGGRDHTTVLHGYRKIEKLAKSDWTVAYDLAHVELLIQ